MGKSDLPLDKSRQDTWVEYGKDKRPEICILLTPVVRKGHLLWNGGRILSEYLESHVESLVKGRNVLELGAGGGLPSLVCAIHGAKNVVVTDFPDSELIDNLSFNIANCSYLPQPPNISAQGYRWGADTQPLKAALTDVGNVKSTNVFETLILADLMFNHLCHGDMIQTIQQTLVKNSAARALVFFTPYRPWLLDADMNFFTLVKDEATGLQVEELGKWEMERVMFDEDPGDEKLRRTVFAFEISWKPEHLAG